MASEINLYTFVHGVKNDTPHPSGFDYIPLKFPNLLIFKLQ